MVVGVLVVVVVVGVLGNWKWWGAIYRVTSADPTAHKSSKETHP